MSAYNINDLVREAQVRWLKPAEVLFILQNYENRMITHEVPQQPGNGGLFLYNKRVLRYFRKDGHSWRRKRDGRTVGEAHERLKVGNVETLNCYYAHGEPNTNFQRRSFWMLDPAYEHIVLVHYRDISEGRNNAGNTPQSSPISPSTFSLSPVSYNTQNNEGNTPQSSPISPSPYSQSPGSYNTQNNAGNTPHSSPISPSTYSQSPGSYNTQKTQPGSSVLIRESFQEYPSLPSSGHGTSRALNFNSRERPEEVQSSGLDMTSALRMLEKKLSLNDNDTMEEIISPYTENSLFAHTSSAPVQGDNNEDHQQWWGPDGWKEVQEDVPQVRDINELNENGLLHAEWATESRQDDYNWFSSIDELAQNLSDLEPEQYLTGPAISTRTSSHVPDPPHMRRRRVSNLDNYASLFDHDPSGVSLQDNLGITISQKQKFTIREISPEWGYASEETKVFIIGSFLSDPFESVWTCMFGGIEVSTQIIQDGVICCHAPEHLPGKVSFYITSGNRESCSEVREFEYRDKTAVSSDFTKPEQVPTRTQEELLLLVRLGQLLLPIPSLQRGDSSDSGIDLLGKSKAGEDSWDQAIDALWFGTSTSSSTTDWLLEELLKDKLQNWLSSRLQREVDQETSVLLKKEQGIIHIIAGLGFEWALPLILNAGVSINFRDIKGWTALHWAARFGREKMVAALIASGASAGAVTDPNQQDPTGKTPAAIASAAGHKGLAGYLSEVALTSHLSSLTLEQSELSKGFADVEAERTLNSVMHAGSSFNDDHVSLKHSLAAVRNAAQAAARIQSAFRAHSFRRRQERGDAGSSSTMDEFGILPDDIEAITTASRLALRNSRDHNLAALSIQKKYRGYKGRKDFLSFRQKVVKIQAHVRGYQVRKNYKVCWAVGVLEKVILRWRRHGVGLRGFRNEIESIDEDEEEEILKVFRKQKVDAAVDEAVKRVLSMVESPDARNQYRRLLEKFRKAKAELELQGGGSEAGSSSTHQNNLDDDDDIYQFA